MKSRPTLNGGQRNSRKCLCFALAIICTAAITASSRLWRLQTPAQVQDGSRTAAAALSEVRGCCGWRQQAASCMLCEAHHSVVSCRTWVRHGSHSWPASDQAVSAGVLIACWPYQCWMHDNGNALRICRLFMAHRQDAQQLCCQQLLILQSACTAVRCLSCMGTSTVLTAVRGMAQSVLQTPP